jgi:hypothetical protein
MPLHSHFRYQINIKKKFGTNQENQALPNKRRVWEQLPWTSPSNHYEYALRFITLHSGPDIESFLPFLQNFVTPLMLARAVLPLSAFASVPMCVSFSVFELQND